METVASSAVCMRGRHRHRSSGVTVGCVRPWVYQRGYRISLPHFFPPIPPLPLSTTSPRVSSFFRGPASGRRDFRLAGEQRLLAPSGCKTRVVMVTALSATPPRQHGRRPTHPFSPTHSTSLPPLPKCRGSARGCSRSGGGGGESTPAVARNPHGGMAYTRSKNPRTGTSATHSRLAVSAIRLRVYVCEICICVSYRPGS